MKSNLVVKVSRGHKEGRDQIQVPIKIKLCT